MKLTKMIVLVALVMAVVGAVSLPAQAYYIDFTIASSIQGTPTPGTLSFAGGNNPLIGRNIRITAFTLSDDLGNTIADAVPIDNGVLNFQTGERTGFSNSPSQLWEFGGGSLSYITITGGIGSIPGILDDAVLLSGSFGRASVTKGEKTYYVAGSNFSDTKNLTLLDYFGIPQQVADGTFSFNVATTSTEAPNAFSSSNVRGGAVSNYLVAAVPAPSTVLLLGSGLVGLLALRIRRKAQ